VVRQQRHVLEIYENGSRISSQALVDNSPSQQDAEYSVTARPNGTYTYYCKLINSFGVSTSDTISVTVTKGGASDTTSPACRPGSGRRTSPRAPCP